MKIGINLPVLSDTWDSLTTVKPDYVEIQAWSYVNMSDGDFEKSLESIKKTGIPVYCANGLFMPTLKLTGENATPKREIEDYLKKCLARAEKLGVKTAVFGSGTARSYGENSGYEKAKEQLLDIAGFIGDVAGRFDIRIAIEPLNSFETNMITTVKEGAEFCRTLNHPYVKLLADSYHMLVENEPFSSLKDYSDVLIHSHIACGEILNRQIRGVPEKTDKYGLKKYTDELLKMGNIRTLTIEALDWQNAENPVAVLKEGVETLKNWTGK